MKKERAYRRVLFFVMFLLSASTFTVNAEASQEISTEMMEETTTEIVQETVTEVLTETATEATTENATEATTENATEATTETTEEKAEDTTTAPVEKAEKIYQKTGKWLLENVDNPKNATIKGEWAILGLARSKYSVPEGYFDIYINNVISRMKEKNGILNKKKYTEYSRIILALTAIGYDVTNVGGYNLLSYLSDYENVVWQGVNGPSWALLALDSYDYEIPVVADGGRQNTREDMIWYILSEQHPDGGWSLDDVESDVDVTAMVLQALSNYYSANEKVKVAVDKGVSYLVNRQNADGTFSTIGVANAESTAQVIVALCCLGINPNEDTRFTKESRTLIDTLCQFSVEEGGFRHVMDGSVNQMASEQCYYALCAYFRLENHQSSLYRMKETGESENAPVEELEIPEVPVKIPEKPKKEKSSATENITIEAEKKKEKKKETKNTEKKSEKPKTKTINVTKEKVTYRLSKKTKEVIKAIDRLADEPELLLDVFESYEELTEKEKLFVDNYELLQRCMDEKAMENHYDERSKIIVVEDEEKPLPWYIKIQVEEQEPDSVTFSQLKEKLGEGFQMHFFYRINFTDIRTGEVYVPDKPVTVQVIPPKVEEGQNHLLLYLHEDGMMEFIEGKESVEYQEIEIEAGAALGSALYEKEFDSLIVLKEPEENETKEKRWAYVTVTAMAAFFILLFIRWKKGKIY